MVQPGWPLCVVDAPAGIEWSCRGSLVRPRNGLDLRQAGLCSVHFPISSGDFLGHRRSFHGVGIYLGVLQQRASGPIAGQLRLIHCSVGQGPIGHGNTLVALAVMNKLLRSLGGEVACKRALCLDHQSARADDQVQK